MGRSTRVISKIKQRQTLDGISVKEAVQDYLQCAHVKELSNDTQIEYNYELGEFAQWCVMHTMIQDKARAWIAVEITEESDESPILLHMINDQAIHLFIEHVKATHTPKKGSTMSTYTLAGYVRVIKSFLNWCLLDQEYSKQIQYSAVNRIKKPQVIKVIIEPFSPAQIKALFEACQREESEHLQLRDEAMIAILLDSGLRAEELVTLTIGDLSTDPRDAYVRVLGKGQKWGEVGLGERARKAVEKYIKDFRVPTITHELKQAHPNVSPVQLKQLLKKELPNRTVFMNRYAAQMQANGLYQLFRRLGRWAGIQGVRCSPHTCRHTFAYLYMKNGGDIYILSKLLRHSSVKVTEEYLKALMQSEARHNAKSVLDNL